MGQNAVELLVLHHIATVITGKTGTRARNLLKNASILLHISEKEGAVHEILQEFLKALPEKAGHSPPQAPPK
jgi:predicted Fe-Mo cluster-binding NifX family protein